MSWLQTSLVHWGFQSYIDMFGDYYFPKLFQRDKYSIQTDLTKWMKRGKLT